MGRAWDRILLGLMALGYLIASLILLFASIGWTTPVVFIENYLLYTTNRWVQGILGTAVFIGSLALVLGSIRKKPDRQAALHETALGTIRITLPALELLVAKAARSVQGIREVKPFLKPLPDGLLIRLKAQVMPDVNIPYVTSELQKTIQEYIQKTAGIKVSEIRVLVNKVSLDVKSRVE